MKFKKKLKKYIRNKRHKEEILKKEKKKKSYARSHGLFLGLFPASYSKMAPVITVSTSVESRQQTT
jgi:hypothetical protein